MIPAHVRRAVLTAVLLLLPANTVSAYDCPLPRCDYCLPAAEIEAPGVGFELTDSYGTTSVQYYNRTIEQVALISGATEYHHLLTQLSLSTSVPTQSFLERWRRRLNKRLGRPATANVGIIASLLRFLRNATEQQLGSPLDRVVVTVPQFPALTREDLADAIEHVGLRSWLEYPLPYPTMLYTPNAAYAGNGHGLCTEWRDIYACEEEEESGEISREKVLAVTYTNTTLLASVSRIAYAFRKDEDSHRAFPFLGHLAMHNYGSPDEYWKEVVRQLRDALDSFVPFNGRQITHIVLAGEKAGDEGLSMALKQVFEDRYLPMMQISRIADPTWAASRGAAMYARIRQEVPWDCRELEKCETERERKQINDEL